MSILRYTISRRDHSRYRRRVGDLALSGRSVQLVVVAHRFRCDAVPYGWQFLAERFACDSGSISPADRAARFYRSILASRLADAWRQALPGG